MDVRCVILNILDSLGIKYYQMCPGAYYIYRSRLLKFKSDGIEVHGMIDDKAECLLKLPFGAPEFHQQLMEIFKCKT